MRNGSGSKTNTEDLLVKFDAFLLTERRVARNTFNAYKKDIEQFIFFIKKINIELFNVKKSILKDFLYFLKHQGLSARSMARKISSLKIFFAYLNDHYNFENITQDLIFPKIEKKLPDYLSEKEVEDLFSFSDKDKSEKALRNKIMIYLLYVSGVRVSELINLKISQIQFDSGFINILGKGGRERLVPLPQEMFALIREYLQTAHREFTHRAKQHTDYLFPVSYAGKIKPISRQSFWIILNNISKRMNVKGISPHKLRHSLATHLLKRGADLRSLQLLLGHENLSTVEIYTHVETSYLRKIYDEKHPRSK